MDLLSGILVLSGILHRLLCVRGMAAARFVSFGAVATRRFAATAASTSAASAPPSFRGVFPILATPFRADESLDLEGFRRTVEFMADAGVDGVTVVGVLGESNRLVDAERARLIETAVSVAKSRNSSTAKSQPGGAFFCSKFSLPLNGLIFACESDRIVLV